MSRFEVGDAVQIRNVIFSRYVGRRGRVMSVRISPRSLTLDKYTVVFPDQGQSEFWSIQLERVPNYT